MAKRFKGECPPRNHFRRRKSRLPIPVYRAGFYALTSDGFPMHVNGPRDMSEKTLAALVSLADAVIHHHLAPVWDHIEGFRADGHDVQFTFTPERVPQI